MHAHPFGWDEEDDRAQRLAATEGIEGQSARLAVKAEQMGLELWLRREWKWHENSRA
jgi:hypothetical protein